MKCVTIGPGGAVIEQAGAVPPDCDFMLMSVTEFEKLTYWADLAIQLEPGEGLFYPLAGAMIAAYASIAGVRLVVRALATENKKV